MLDQEPLENKMDGLICQSKNPQSPGTVLWETQPCQMHTWPLLRTVEKSDTTLTH